MQLLLSTIGFSVAKFDSNIAELVWSSSSSRDFLSSVDSRLELFPVDLLSSYSYDLTALAL